MATSIYAKVIALKVDRLGASIGLDNDPSIGPKGNEFRLELEHANYNALYSLALAAAANRWPLLIRIAGDGQIDPGVEAVIKSLAVGWRAGAVDND